MNLPTQPDKVRRAHCSFCGGRGADLQVEVVTSASIGRTFRVPLSHAACKASILSLSLSLLTPSPALSPQPLQGAPRGKGVRRTND